MEGVGHFKGQFRYSLNEVNITTLGFVYICDFSRLLQLFCDKMGIEPN